ncbi:MAG TPA: hypothetical protein GX743_05125, partial [Actinomycetales bacterium]|nr:hypothetical protein [Actinomycetales bacterium]
TTAVTAVLLLARIRRERIALLGLGPDPTALAVRSGCLPRYSTEDVATALDQRRDAALEDVLALMDQIAANGWAIGYQRDPSSHSAARLARTFSQLFGATLVDAGSALQGQTMSLLDTSNAVVLLGDGSKEGMRSIEVAFSNLMATGLVPTTQLVIGLVQTVKSSKIDLGWESDIVRRQGIRSVGIPWDPQLATAQQVRPELLGPTTLRAFARLLAEVVDTSMSAGGAA